MTKVRFLVAGAGAALAIGAAALANVGAATLTASDSHGDAVASAARTTCPHGGHGVHGECVSDIASSKSEGKTSTESEPADTCKASDAIEDSTEKAGKKAENASEKGAKTTKAQDKAEDSSEKSAERSEDKTEKQQATACEASEASD